MGAKSRLLFLLVASLIGIGFALIPASKAETSHQIESIEHFDAEIDNNIEISVENKIDKEIPYSLTIDVFSEDLQQEIELLLLLREITMIMITRVVYCITH